MTFKPAISLYDALVDPRLFGPTFGADSFWPWRVVAKLIDGTPLTEPREIALYRAATGRSELPDGPVRRLFDLIGRRGGKDRFASAVAVWRAALCADWRAFMSAGEQAVVLLLGADKRQAQILRRYCLGLLQAPLLKAEVTRVTDAGVIECRNGAVLEVATNNAALVRGRSAIAVIGSECCHWRTDEASASSDEEVYNGAVPSMAMCPDGGLLLFQSSVYRKRGLMFRKWKELHGRDDADDLCWFAESALMNPRLPARVIDKAMAEDAVKSGAEFLNRWRDDVSDFVPADVIEAVTDWGVRERAPDPGVSYVAYCDAASGTGSDSFTMAIAHRLPDDVGSVVLDVLRERRPRFVPRDVIAEYAALLKEYRIGEVSGDAYAGGFHSDEWLRAGIRYRPSDYTTSDTYLRALPMLLAARARLLDNERLRSQFISLERRVQSVSGREVVTHPAAGSAHDDLPASTAGVLVLAGDRTAYNTNYEQWVGGDGTDPLADWQAMRTWAYLNSGGLVILW